MNRPVAFVLVALSAVGVALLAPSEARSQHQTYPRLYPPQNGTGSQDQADQADPPSVDPLLNPSVNTLLHAIRLRGANMSDREFENAIEKACIAFYRAAEAAELEREARKREEAADAALHDAAKSLLEVTETHAGTKAAAKAQKAFKATGLVVLESGTIYDPEIIFNFGWGPIFR